MRHRVTDLAANSVFAYCILRVIAGGNDFAGFNLCTFLSGTASFDPLPLRSGLLLLLSSCKNGVRSNS